MLLADWDGLCVSLFPNLLSAFCPARFAVLSSYPVTCPDCNHAYEYTLDDVRSGLRDTQVRDQGLTDDSVLRIEARCGEENCGAPVYILLTAPLEQVVVYSADGGSLAGGFQFLRKSREMVSN